MTTARTAGGATIDARVATSGDFKTWIAEYVGPSVDITVRVSAGYVRNGTVSLGVPSFTGVAGWLPSWGLQTGAPVGWSVFGVNLDANTIEMAIVGGVPPYQAASRNGQVTP